MNIQVNFPKPNSGFYPHDFRPSSNIEAWRYNNFSIAVNDGTEVSFRADQFTGGVDYYTFSRAEMSAFIRSFDAHVYDGSVCNALIHTFRSASGYKELSIGMDTANLCTMGGKHKHNLLQFPYNVSKRPVATVLYRIFNDALAKHSRRGS